MSQFIEAPDILESPPIFELESKQIVKPDTEKIWQNICDRKHRRRNSDGMNQRKYMSNVYQKLMNEQKQQLNIQNANQIKDSYANLKQKWSKSCEEGSGIVDFFQIKRFNIYNEFCNRRSRLNLKTVYGQMPKKVEMIRKHNNKIMLKLGSVYELQQIRKSKQKYQNWFDRNKNPISKSPILKNINKILKEIGKKQARIETVPAYDKRKPNSSYQALSKKKKNVKNLLEIENSHYKSNIYHRFGKKRNIQTKI